MKRKRPAGFDLVSAEAHARLEAWSEQHRTLFGELVEDAPTDLQRELLSRAVVAGHSPQEVHAFADALRGLSDAEAFDKCTLNRERAPDYGVVQLLKAEADPLFAFELQGGELSPAEEAGPKVTDVHPPYVPPGGKGRDRPQFDAKDDGALKRAAKEVARELGQSPEDKLPARPARAQVSSSPGAPAALGPALAQDYLNEALFPLGVTFREHSVDGPGQPRLEELLPLAAGALLQGLPVPVALGPSPGQDRRLAVLLQVQHSGESRAFQLFDVVSQELAWVNEQDFYARTELPFAQKHNRRITRLALPSSRSL